MEDLAQERSEMLVGMTAEIVAAHVSNNPVSAREVGALIASVHGALAGLGADALAEQPPIPAVSIRSSVRKDRLTCLDCGRKLKTLRRHLGSEHNMTPQDYREKWGLGDDYPMVAAEYSRSRSALAKHLGLGRKPGQARGRRKTAK